MKTMKKDYYDLKYPVWYPYSKPNGERGIMYTIPVKELVKIYSKHTNHMPKTFFDCGAANGQLLLEAEKMGIAASGVEKEKYILASQAQRNLVKQGKLQIKPIEKCPPVKADLAYCNGVLTYMDTTQLALTMSKFANTDMVIVSLDTIDDALDAKEKDAILPVEKEQKLKPIIWWVAYFQAAGFDAGYNFEHQCFVLTPMTLKNKMKSQIRQKPKRKLRVYPTVDLQKKRRTKKVPQRQRQIEMQEKAENRILRDLKNRTR